MAFSYSLFLEKRSIMEVWHGPKYASVFTLEIIYLVRAENFQKN